MLVVDALAVARGGVPVLEGLSFEVPTGEALILRGPNGIGKTTLLRSLAGLQEPLSGTISGAGEEAAYASHSDGVKAALTVEENLSFWAEIYGNAVPESIYDAFDLTDLRERLAGTLSSGQARRLGLSRLGVIGRKVLFLDEPTISLDAFSVKLFARWLRESHLNSGGLAVIATHIDLGLEAPELELASFAAKIDATGGSDEAFL